ncbi:Conserved membrane protein in copper uptake, YcnI [Actinomycetales bacterium JB111]|nr:Conserved membrane protein in copper uptake, YcnI [Actinomycetales bacterium JB111]
MGSTGQNTYSGARSIVRGGTIALGAAALVVVGAVSAGAHVTISSDTDEAGAYALLTVSVPHGCDGSATTSVAIQIPEEITSVTPTRNALYEVEAVSEELDTPITDSHGNEVTERVAEIVYTTDSPLPDAERDAFELSLRLPEEAAGTTLYFPVVQTCEEGEAPWVEIPAEGQDGESLDHPAPSISIVEAGAVAEAEPEAAADTTVSQDASAGDQSSVSDATDESSQTPLVITSLVVGALGLLVGLVALVRGRKRS